MKDFNIERILQPDVEAFRKWNLGDIVPYRHFPRGTLNHKSPGEGYGIKVSSPVFADLLAMTLAGYLQDGDPTSDYGVGVSRPQDVRIPTMHIFKCPEGADPIHTGVTNTYVLEGTAPDMRSFLQGARLNSIDLLLHEGAHPHRGDLPKFVNWLESVKAIPGIQ